MSKKRSSIKQSLLIILSLFIANLIALVTLFLLQETYVHPVIYDFMPVLLVIVVPLFVGFISKSKLTKGDLIFLLIIELIMIGIAALHYQNIYSSNLFVEIASGYLEIFNFNEIVILENIISNYYESEIMEKLVYSVVSICYPLVSFIAYYIGGIIKSKD